MPKVFEIIKGTEAYQSIDKIFNRNKQYTKEFREEFRAKIGVEWENNCSSNVHQLLLEHIPEGTEDQFQKTEKLGRDCCFRVAKVKSKLNKAYLELIKKYNIVDYRLMDFILQHIGVATSSKVLKQASRAFDRYFLELNEDCPEWAIEELNKKDFLKEISEPEFLRLRADYLESLESQAKKEAS